MNEHEVLLLNVGNELEADAVIAALGDSGIAAYKKTVPNPGLLAMPGAFGLAENGIDIVVRVEDGPKAASVVVGIGYEPKVEPADPEDGEEEQGKPRPMTVEEQKKALSEDYAKLHPLKKILLIGLILLMVAGIVWMTDFIVETIKSLI